MKNVILFPGTDAVENEKNRNDALQINGVVERLRATERIIKEEFGEELRLVDYMSEPNDLSVLGFTKLVMCSLATQVAIYEEYVLANGTPDCVMGLSLGDVPRSVVSELVTFEEGVRILYLFTSMHSLATPGMSVHIKLSNTFAESEDLLQLEKYQISKSVVQNEKFGLLAGSMDRMQSWMKEVAYPNKLNIKPMYPFPLHTVHMAPVADMLQPHIVQVCKIANKKMDVFSVIYCKMLTTSEGAVRDCVQNISSELNFPKSIHQIIDIYGDVKFVNIGPSNSLMKFLKHMNLPTNVKMMDWFEESLMVFN